MAVIITSISRSESLTMGGGIVLIEGSGFFVPTPSERQDHKTAPSVQVKFGDLISPNSFSVSDTKIYSTVPKFFSSSVTDLPKTVEITVTNYDANENLTVDSYTLTDSFIYRRPLLTSESILTTVVRTIIASLMNQIHRNIYWTTDQDYDEMMLDGFSYVAKRPAFIIVGPQLPRNYMLTDGVSVQTSESPDDVFFKKAPKYVDMIWQFFGITMNPIQSLNLVNVVESYFENNTYLKVGTKQYPMILTFDGISEDTTANDSGTHIFSGSFRIEGIETSLTIGEPGIETDEDIFTAINGQSIANEIEEIIVIKHDR